MSEMEMILNLPTMRCWCVNKEVDILWVKLHTPRRVEVKPETGSVCFQAVVPKLAFVAKLA